MPYDELTTLQQTLNFIKNTYIFCQEKAFEPTDCAIIVTEFGRAWKIHMNMCNAKHNISWSRATYFHHKVSW